ncbi:hypothetical protein HMPREF1573_01395 [Gardnerella vaginalis JCP7276]|nr:hypothetical protein HMPREF1573_01395 [Gardnerella vaginalis JCP7276]
MRKIARALQRGLSALYLYHKRDKYNEIKPKNVIFVSSMMQI